MKINDLYIASDRILKGIRIENDFAYAEEPMMRSLASAFLLSSLAHPEEVSEALQNNSDVYILAQESAEGMRFVNRTYLVPSKQLLEGVALFYSRADAEKAYSAQGHNVSVLTVEQAREI
jgi:hypothetical protein